MDIKTSKSINTDILHENLKKVFGFNNFRGKQEEAGAEQCQALVKLGIARQAEVVLWLAGKAV